MNAKCLPPPFRADFYQLDDVGLWLSPPTDTEAASLGQALAATEPWARYGTRADSLTSLIRPASDGGIRLALRLQKHGAPIGVMAIRHPWLTGPYLQFLAVQPGFQRQGYGHAVLNWFEREARQDGARNLWICAATFNIEAQRLYQLVGFEPVIVLDDLIKPNFDEVLMRKRLTPSDS
jgi:diamine N-acetyltransferase